MATDRRDADRAETTTFGLLPIESILPPARRRRSVGSRSCSSAWTPGRIAARPDRHDDRRLARPGLRFGLDGLRAARPRGRAAAGRAGLPAQDQRASSSYANRYPRSSRARRRARPCSRPRSASCSTSGSTAGPRSTCRASSRSSMPSAAIDVTVRKNVLRRALRRVRVRRLRDHRGQLPPRWRGGARLRADSQGRRRKRLHPCGAPGRDRRRRARPASSRADS